MPNVKVYTSRSCAFCGAAKRLLAARGVAYEEIDVTGDYEKRVWLAETTRRRTVPQIFIGGEPIGGYDDLVALDRSGKLAVMVEGDPAAAGGPH
jgi:glutaredoxin 3